MGCIRFFLTPKGYAGLGEGDKQLIQTLDEENVVPKVTVYFFGRRETLKVPFGV